MGKLSPLLLASILLAGMVQAAGYLKFDGIEGEVSAPGYSGWSEMLSLDKQMALSQEGASRRTRIIAQDIQVSKSLDKSSPKLAEAIATGKVFPMVELHLTYMDDGAEMPYLKYELKNVQITSYQLGTLDADVRPVEELSLNYEEIKMTYTEQDEDGTAGGETVWSWIRSLLVGR